MRVSEEPDEKKCSCGGAELSDEERNALGLWQSLTPELRKVVQGLPDLPEAVRAGIVAMVKATEKER